MQSPSKITEPNLKETASTFDQALESLPGQHMHTKLPLQPDGQLCGYNLKLTPSTEMFNRMQLLGKFKRILETAGSIPLSLPEALRDAWGISEERAVSVLNTWGRGAFQIVSFRDLSTPQWELEVQDMVLSGAPPCTLSILEEMSVRILVQHKKVVLQNELSGFHNFRGTVSAEKVKALYNRALSVRQMGTTYLTHYLLIPRKDPSTWITRKVGLKDPFSEVMWNPLIMFIAQSSALTFYRTGRAPIHPTEWSLHWASFCRTIVHNSNPVTAVAEASMWSAFNKAGSRPRSSSGSRTYLRTEDVVNGALSLAPFMEEDAEAKRRIIMCHCTKLVTDDTDGGHVSLWTVVPAPKVPSQTQTQSQRYAAHLPSAWHARFPSLWEEPPEVTLYDPSLPPVTWATMFCTLCTGMPWNLELEVFKRRILVEQCPFAPMLPWIQQNNLAVVWASGSPTINTDTWVSNIHNMYSVWSAKVSTNPENEHAMRVLQDINILHAVHEQEEEWVHS